MVEVPFADRVVEVIVDLGPNSVPRYRYASGCIVGGRTVLTAAHAVFGAGSVWVRGPDKQPHEARIDSRFVADPAVVDLALLEMDAQAGLPVLPVAVLSRSGVVAEVVDGCYAVGYPRFKEREDTSGATIRDTAGVHGQVSTMSNLVSGWLTLQVTSAPRPLPGQAVPVQESEWSGMSGAPVLADGYLLGVVTEHAPREGSSALSVTPVTHVNRLPNASEWWQRLGVADPSELPRLPAPAKPLLRTVPAQLPTDVQGFAGRDQELAQLDDLVTGRQEPTAVRIAVVSGTAGVGKTTLALHWAHRIRDRFPDGQLYVNLRGFDRSETAMDPAEALRGFLDALGVVPQRLPADLAGQGALYRSLLDGKRFLIVLDNAHDADQVRPLLPGSPSCLVLVTSRNQLASLIVTEGARPIDLDVLTTDEAQDLLVRRLSRRRIVAELKAAVEIIALCAGLPLALAIVAARAATHMTFPLSALAAELRGARAGLDAFAGLDIGADVRAVFSWSYRQVSQEAARMFRLLGLHPGPEISAPAAASLAGVALPQARALLAELTNAHLVSEPAPGRYAFHDLLRAYATELVFRDDGTERQSAVRRMLDHYVHTTHAAAVLVNPVRRPIVLDPPQPGVTPERHTDRAGAMAWFDRGSATSCWPCSAKPTGRAWTPAPGNWPGL